MKDISSEEVEYLLNYMYVGEVNVSQEKLANLIKAAECLRIKGLAISDDDQTQLQRNSDKRTNDQISNFDHKRKKRKDSMNSLDPKHVSKKIFGNEHPQMSSLNDDNHAYFTNSDGKAQQNVTFKNEEDEVTNISSEVQYIVISCNVYSLNTYIIMIFNVRHSHSKFTMCSSICTGNHCC